MDRGHSFFGGVLLGLGPRRQLLIECSGLGGAPIFDSIQGDLFLKCMSTTPVYGPSLAHLDIYDDNQKYRHTTSIGRMTQIHDFHMLHAAAWPKGVKTWTVKTHLEECTTRYLGFKCFLFSVYRVYHYDVWPFDQRQYYVSVHPAGLATFSRTRAQMHFSR